MLGLKLNHVSKRGPSTECAFFRMVHGDRFKSACVLTELMRNLYGVGVGHKKIDNRHVVKGYHARRILRKPLLTANHCLVLTDWPQRWQNLTVAAWSHVIWGDDHTFSCILSMAAWELFDWRESSNLRIWWNFILANIYNFSKLLENTIES